MAIKEEKDKKCLVNEKELKLGGLF